MISWIQRSFHKHFRWVFALVLAAMAIPLIVIFNPSSGGNRTGYKVLERPFFNVNLGNDAQKRRVFLDGNLSASLGPQFSLFASREGVEKYSLERVAGLALADELHLPTPTADQISRFVLTLRGFQNEQGQFDQKRYLNFGDLLKTGGQFTMTDANRVLRDDTRLEQLNKLIGGPGYVLPNDVKLQLVRSDSSWTVQVATLDYAGFAPVINASDEALKKFLEENSFRYDVPARPRFSYVEFKGTDYQPPVGPTEAEMRAFFSANTASFPVPADPDKKDAVTANGTTDNFPKVRAQVEAAMKNSASARLASKAANDLTVALYEHKLTANSTELAAFLAAQHLTVAPIAPYAPDNPPQDKPWLASYGEQIARLSSTRFFSDPLPTADSFVVLIWNDNLPAYKPLFAEVKERVAADFKESEKRRLFIERGQALRAQLQIAAKTAAGFASAAAAEKLELKTYANFTLRQPPADLPVPALRALPGLETGQVAEMSATADKGFIVYAQEKKMPDLNPRSPRYVEQLKQGMRISAMANGNSYLGELVERELKKTASTPEAP
jgi:peptidyl-prolyl cis-trans isomerase D